MEYDYDPREEEGPDFPEELDHDGAVDGEDYEPTVLDQFGLVSYLTACPDVWALATPILKPDYFDNEFATVIDFCMKYADRYKKLPSNLVIRSQTGVKLEVPDDVDDPRTQKWLCEAIESHCRHKAAIQLILKSSEMVGGKKAVPRTVTAALQEEWKAINLMSLQRSLGVEVHTGVKDALLRAKDNSGIPCGLTHLDRILDGGFNRKSLNLFVMSSGGGKSVIMSNLAYNYARIHKFNVIYVTLELDEDLTQKRFVSIMTGCPTTDVYQRMDDIDKELRLRMFGQNKKEGHVFLKKMPMNGTTSADIMAYIHDLMIQTGLKFDVLIVDYLDLMTPRAAGIDMNKEHLKDKYCTEELRAICDELNLIGFTASQRTKGSEDDGENDSQGHVAGGSTKVNTVDNLIFGRRSDRDREEGRMWLTSKKSRTSAAHGKRFPVRFCNNTLIISDCTEEEFANALPFLSVKDIANPSSVQRQYGKSSGTAQPKAVNNAGTAQSSALNSFMRKRGVGVA